MPIGHQPLQCYSGLLSTERLDAQLLERKSYSPVELRQFNSARLSLPGTLQRRGEHWNPLTLMNAWLGPGNAGYPHRSLGRAGPNYFLYLSLGLSLRLFLGLSLFSVGPNFPALPARGLTGSFLMESRFVERCFPVLLFFPSLDIYHLR